MQNLHVEPIAALTDNYIWLLADADRRAVLVDPGESEPVLGRLRDQRMTPVAILLTHHHADHVGGVAGIKRAFPQVIVIAPQDDRISIVDRRVGDGDRLVLAGRFEFDVLAVPGHTLTHVAYVGHDLLFSGDTLFGAGCGRLFEGTPAQMLASLDRLTALSDEVRVCCGHEYTAANLRFAKSIEVDNYDLDARIDEVSRLRATGRPSLPSTIRIERATNPFLRIDAQRIVEATGGPGRPRVERFAELRRRKDDFR